MSEEGIDAALLTHKMSIYYLSGTSQNGVLFAPSEGEPLLMIKREYHRARMDSPLRRVVEIKSLSEIQSHIDGHLHNRTRILGIEMDVLPVKAYFRLKELFPNTRLKDISSVICEMRKIKSDYEIQLMKTAGSIGEKVYEEGRILLREGMTEIEFGGLLETIAKRYGHEGLLRVRSSNYEAYTWHILSGINGGIVSQSDSPMGGLGLSPAFPVGASLKTMTADEPILVDFGTCYHGYQADETRMYAIRRMPKKFHDAYQACCEIHDRILEDIRPNAICADIFNKSVRIAEQLGYGDYYLGPSGFKTRFVGHGLGLELNEFPFLAAGHNYPLQEGMTFALEPKIVFPGEGAVGIENTIAVTDTGYERLTPLDQELMVV
jgi:Xaa-Pro aminopeptidase